MPADPLAPPLVSIIVVSYNTCDLTLACLRSVYEQTRRTAFELLVADNNSVDGSVEAIAHEFPQARIFAQRENVGFASANNFAAQHAAGGWLLLLNPDTVVLDGAIDRLIEFAAEHPDNRIYGGRTVFEDGSLNPASCWHRITLWSMSCHAFGLSSVFRRSALLDSESMGRWLRDTVREVDIVSGCFLLIRREFWNELGGFDRAFFMYGEEADLCLRAKTLGARPIICPDAHIVHYGGRSERVKANKLVLLLGARRRLICRYWPWYLVPLGKALQDLAILNRLLGSWAIGVLRGNHRTGAGAPFREIWSRRKEWQSVTA